MSSTPVAPSQLQSFSTARQEIQSYLRRFNCSVTATAAVTLGGYDHVFCDATGGNIAVLVPLARSKTNTAYWVQKTDVSANTVTLNRSGSDTIGGSTSVVLSAQNEWIRIYSDGTTWRRFQ